MALSYIASVTNVNYLTRVGKKKLRKSTTDPPLLLYVTAMLLYNLLLIIFYNSRYSDTFVSRTLLLIVTDHYII